MRGIEEPAEKIGRQDVTSFVKTVFHLSILQPLDRLLEHPVEIAGKNWSRNTPNAHYLTIHINTFTVTVMEKNTRKKFQTLLIFCFTLQALSKIRKIRLII